MLKYGCLFNGAFGVSLKSRTCRPRACRVSIDNQAFDVFLAEKLQRVQNDFAVFDDPQERLSAVIDRARKIPPLPSTDRIDENRVQGCVSIVWLVGEVRDGRCLFRSDAESPVVRGLLAFLCDFFNGATPAEIADSTSDPLAALELTQNLSPTRRNGLAAAHRAIVAFARRSL
jgi:cysteine desulfuration protein SufE